ncbi:hypothetical protein L218DRAFT_474445 [Marasmius fiardii PR-910]|nr:hypothetical protein L218DRAFT_474445 [Marasmius fiardii PR-910]
MHFNLPILTTVVLSALSVADAAKICARCSNTIVYSGLTRKLTLVRQSSVSTLNTVQCNYDSPSISGFSPYCVYNNIDGFGYPVPYNVPCGVICTNRYEHNGCSILVRNEVVMPSIIMTPLAL